MLTVLSHPLIDIKLTTLRDKDTPPHDFRRTLFEIAGLMSFDVFKFLNSTQISVTTLLETTYGYRLAEPAPAIISILRAGNGLADAFSALLPEVWIGHLGLQRNEDTHNPEAYYENCHAIHSRQILPTRCWRQAGLRLWLLTG